MGSSKAESGHIFGTQLNCKDETEQMVQVWGWIQQGVALVNHVNLGRVINFGINTIDPARFSLGAGRNGDFIEIWWRLQSSKNPCQGEAPDRLQYPFAGNLPQSFCIFLYLISDGVSPTWFILRLVIWYFLLSSSGV